MNQSPLRSLVLGYIEEHGRRYGAPTVIFPDRTISVPGDDIHVPGSMFQYLIRLFTGISGFYLALPPNVFGLVIFPDGTSHNMGGGMHEAPPGLYKLQYVDGHERLEFLPPISEMSTDGEKITLTVVLRYRVIDPITALRIDRPVETLIEHVGADVAQYIRTHDHTDMADGSENGKESKLLSFFVQRHNRRFPLSKAFIITGIEIKDFSGDEEYLDIRRRADIESRKSVIEKEQAEHQQELNVLRNQHKAASEKMIAEHTAELAKRATEHRAEIENMEAKHEKEKQEILHQVHLLKIELDDKRQRLQMRKDQFSEVVEALSRHFSTGTPISPAIIKYLMDFFDAYKEDLDGEFQPSPSSQQKSISENHIHPPASTSLAGNDRVENLKNTLLNLLNPKK